MDPKKIAYEEKNLRESLDSHISRGERLTAALESALKVIPAQDESRKECTILRQLLAQKEEAARNVALERVQQQEFLLAIEEQMGRLKQATRLIESSRGALHNLGPKEELDRAGREALQEYQKLAAQRGRIEALLARMHLALLESQAVVSPDEDPDMGGPYVPHTPLGPGKSAGAREKAPKYPLPRISGEFPREEFVDLVSLGPLGTLQQTKESEHKHGENA